MKFRLTFRSGKWQALGAALFLAAIGVITVVISMHPWDAQAEDDSASRLDQTLWDVLRVRVHRQRRSDARSATRSPNRSQAS